MSSKRWAALLVSTALLLAFVVVIYFSQRTTPQTPSAKLPDAAFASAPASRLPASNNSDGGPPANGLKDGKPAKFDESLCKALPSNVFERAAFFAKMQLAEFESAAEIDRLLTRASVASDPLERAAALFVAAQSLDAKTRAAFFEQHPPCGNSELCTKQVNAAAGAAAFKHIDEIAKLAIYSTDPRQYALAFHACQFQANPAIGYCSQISATQWAYRDPGNGTAWLYVATQASKGRRNSEFDEAMFQFSRAKKFDLGLSPLSRLQSSESLQSENVTVHPAVTMMISGVLAKHTWPDYQGVMDYCQIPALRDANRRQVCNDIGTNLARDEATLINRMLGVKLGERLGWADSILDPLREELDAFRALANTPFDALPSASAKADDSEMEACLFGVQVTKQAEDRVRLGEIGALRARMNSQPLTRKALAEQYRAHAQQALAKRQ